MDGGGGQEVDPLAKAGPQLVGKLLRLGAEQGEGLHRPSLEGVQDLPLVAAVILIDPGDHECPWPRFARHLQGLADPDPEAHRQRFARQHLVRPLGPAAGQQGIGGFELRDSVHLGPLYGLTLPAGGLHRAARGRA
ncbi:hypothetical protein D3C79_850710 [compost metagenome]